MDYLRRRARPATGQRGWDLDGWELHTHPDLIDRLGDIARSPRAIVPVYGVAAVAQRDVAVAVVMGTSTLLFRLPVPPSGVKPGTAVDPLDSQGWYAVCPWQSQLPSADGLRTLSNLLKEARGYGNELAAARPG